MNQAYDLGFNAYHSGQDLEDNPFKEGCNDYDEWEAGWVAASGSDE